MGRPVDRPEHRLAHQLDLVTARLDALDTIYEEARTHLHECLALAGGLPQRVRRRIGHHPPDGQPGVLHPHLPRRR
jgi:hypothetical protein